MAEGRRREAWNHTAHILKSLADPYREEGDDPFRPSQFHPLPERMRQLEEQAEREGRKQRVVIKDMSIAKNAIMQGLNSSVR